jgi:hypothetical protein
MQEKLDGRGDGGGKRFLASGDSIKEKKVRINLMTQQTSGGGWAGKIDERKENIFRLQSSEVSFFASCSQTVDLLIASKKAEAISAFNRRQSYLIIC